MDGQALSQVQLGRTGDGVLVGLPFADGSQAVEVSVRGRQELMPGAHDVRLQGAQSVRVVTVGGIELAQHAQKPRDVRGAAAMDRSRRAGGGRQRSAPGPFSLRISAIESARFWMTSSLSAGVRSSISRIWARSTPSWSM